MLPKNPQISHQLAFDAYGIPNNIVNAANVALKPEWDMAFSIYEQKNLNIMDCFAI